MCISDPNLTESKTWNRRHLSRPCSCPPKESKRQNPFMSNSYDSLLSNEQFNTYQWLEIKPHNCSLEGDSKLNFSKTDERKIFSPQNISNCAKENVGKSYFDFEYEKKHPYFFNYPCSCLNHINFSEIKEKKIPNEYMLPCSENFNNYFVKNNSSPKNYYSDWFQNNSDKSNQSVDNNFAYEKEKYNHDCRREYKPAENPFLKNVSNNPSYSTQNPIFISSTSSYLKKGSCCRCCRKENCKNFSCPLCQQTCKPIDSLCQCQRGQFCRSCKENLMKKQNLCCSKGCCCSTCFCCPSCSFNCPCVSCPCKNNFSCHSKKMTSCPFKNLGLCSCRNSDICPFKSCDSCPFKSFAGCPFLSFCFKLFMQEFGFNNLISKTKQCCCNSKRNWADRYRQLKKKSFSKNHAICPLCIRKFCKKSRNSFSKKWKPLQNFYSDLMFESDLSQTSNVESRCGFNEQDTTYDHFERPAFDMRENFKHKQTQKDLDQNDRNLISRRFHNKNQIKENKSYHPQIHSFNKKFNEKPLNCQKTFQVLEQEYYDLINGPVCKCESIGKGNFIEGAQLGEKRNIEVESRDKSENEDFYNEEDKIEDEKNYSDKAQELFPKTNLPQKIFFQKPHVKQMYNFQGLKNKDNTFPQSCHCNNSHSPCPPLHNFFYQCNNHHNKVPCNFADDYLNSSFLGTNLPARNFDKHLEYVLCDVICHRD